MLCMYMCVYYHGSCWVLLTLYNCVEYLLPDGENNVKYVAVGLLESLG